MVGDGAFPMSRSLEKMLRHARSALEASLKVQAAADRTRLHQDFLKIENRRLFSLHRDGAGGVEIANKRSTMMDTLLHYILLSALHTTGSIQKNGYPLEMCLVATGGYGRAELNPYSDVDVLFLLPTARGPELAKINATVEQVLYMLWDLGLKVGHATRTIGECVQQARKDMQSRTALMEARLLDGSNAIFSKFQHAIYEDCLQGRVQEYIADRLKDQAERHAKYGGTVFVQEPNVKNGCGGLRDMQNLLWMARFKTGALTLDELHRKGLLAQIEAGRLSRAYDYLMRVRNELHYAHGHAVDEVTLAFQPKIAEALGYHQKDILLRIEIFMRDYYRHARDIFVLTEALSERLSIENERRRGIGRWSRLFLFGRKPETLEGGLALQDGVIECTETSVFPVDAHDLLHVFRIAQLREARLGANLQSLIRRHLKLVNREFLYSRRARDIFFSILQAKGEVGRTLRMMHQCEFLGEYLPEFGQLDCLVQHEFYHRYTADEHTLVAIEKLDEILNATRGPAVPYSRIFQKLEHVHLLYLAILLHDTGKAARVRHHEDASTVCAQKVARRFCLDHASHSLLLWLVDHHMTMSSLVQRRDIEDPSTIDDFKQIVETRERLDMLHLLTFVDGQAVGNPAWNDWRQSSLWELYEQTARALSTSGLEQINFETRREQLRLAVKPRLSPFIMQDEIEAHFAHIPQRYWGRVDEDELLWHLETLHAFFEGLLDAEGKGSTPAVRWRHFFDRGYSEAIVCSWDRHGLFAKIAGSFAAARINILSADIYTRGDNLVLDIFQVCDLERRSIQDEARMHKMEHLLSESLSGTSEVSFTDQIRNEYESMRRMPHQGEERFPTSVIFNNDDSRNYSIVEIQTPDRLGLLYHILEVFTQCGLDIKLAKINTEMGAAMDVFYFTDVEEMKITDLQRLESIQKGLLATINELNKPYRVAAE